MLRSLGSIVRGVGQVFDSFGARIQGKNAYIERAPLHARFVKLAGQKPELLGQNFVAPNASVCGSVHIGTKSSVFYGAILRGDLKPVQIGDLTTIGDNASIRGLNKGVKIGNLVHVGSGASLQDCDVEDGAHIGAAAIISEGCVIESSAVIAPGSILPPNTRVPKGQLWAGSPAVFVRNVEALESEQLLIAAAGHYWLAQIHAQETNKPLSQSEEERKAYETEWDRDDNFGLSVNGMPDIPRLPQLEPILYPLQLRTYIEVDRPLISQDNVVWLQEGQDPKQVMEEVLAKQGYVDENFDEDKKSYWFVN